MSAENPPLPGDVGVEISALIDSLHESGRRLEELTQGEVDTVADSVGRTFLLRRAQEHLRLSDAARQAAILDALPAHIALLDTQGVIVAVNETWRRLPCTNATEGPGHKVGLNYLEICDTRQGDRSPESHHAAEGIRAVLSGATRNFSLEYPCHSATARRWFKLTVTPLAGDPPSGAIVMHVDVTADVQAEETLRASELRFRQMAENIRDVFFLQNLESSTMFYVSPAYEQIWGRTCESLYANPASWADSIHPADRDYSFRKFSEGRANGGFDYEFRIVRPNGDIRWIHVRGFPIRDDAGKPYRTAGVASDITERKQASDALHESERRFSAILGNVEMISVIVDTTARITYCNDYLLRLTGWARQEVIGRNWFDLFIASPQDGDVRAVLTALLTDMPDASHHENEIITRSGAKRMIQWNNTVLYSNTGEVIGIASLGVDVTESRQAEARLRLQSAALNAADNAMVITRRDGSIVWINPAFTKLTGYTEDEAIGRNQRDLVKSGVHDPGFYKEMWDTLLAGQSWTREMTNRRKDGRLYPESQTITPVKDDGRNISHFISINSDLTVKRQVEAQLRQSQKMEAVGQLAAGVAHEFNNLLQALMSMAAITRLRAGTPEVVKIATEMEVQIKRGASITQQLLLFSRHQVTQKSDLDLGDQVRKASDMLRRLLPENIIIVETAPDRLSVAGDAGQMQQVLLNLAINARDAMPSGGTLTLRAGDCGGGQVFLEVEDTGEGLDDATRAHIFEPFFTTKEVGKGSGLGLAVVHGIVEAHSGHIEVFSVLGQGSCFRVVLPRAISSGMPGPGPETDEPNVALTAASGRVLLVEDEDAVREGIAVLLQLIGYKVTAVATGEETIALPLEPAPDLLLSDITLPGVAGATLAERLSERWPSLRVVLMSGYAEEAVRADASGRGWYFLQKPFEMGVLASQMRAAFEGPIPGPGGPESRPLRAGHDGWLPRGGTEDSVADLAINSHIIA